MSDPGLEILSAWCPLKTKEFSVEFNTDFTIGFGILNFEFLQHLSDGFLALNVNIGHRIDGLLDPVPEGNQTLLLTFIITELLNIFFSCSSIDILSVTCWLRTCWSCRSDGR